MKRYDNRTRIAALEQDPFAHEDLLQKSWPARWIARPDTPADSHVTLYRRVFDLTEPTAFRLHVSGDQWFELFLDGGLVLRGPSIGCAQRWFFHTLELDLDAGQHELVARVFALPEPLRPNPVMSLGPGFLCCTDPDHPLLDEIATGRAKWQWRDISGGWTFGKRGILDPLKIAFGPVEQRLPAAGAWPPDGTAGDWFDELATREAISGANDPHNGRLLSTLAQAPTGRNATGLLVRNFSNRGTDDVYTDDPSFIAPPAWAEFVKGGAVTIAANQRVRLLIDCDDYLLGFTHLDVESNGCLEIGMAWAERLLKSLERESVGDTLEVRSRIDGLFCPGPRDTWILEEGGRHHLTTPWRRCGRYLQIVIETSDAEATLSGFRIEDALPPSPFSATFDSDDKLLGAVLPICRRGLEVGLESTFCDTPYWEQVQWVGDMYPILLCHLATGGENPVHRQALVLAADSIRGRNPTQAVFPVASGDSSIIPSFSLWYILMVHDFALWRGHRDFIRSLLPALRHNLDYFLAQPQCDGLYRTPPGWHYFDWAEGWTMGGPPLNGDNVCGLLNLLIVLAADRLASLENWLDEPEMASRWRRMADTVGKACAKILWVPERGLYADTPGIDSFSEHGQVLALLNPHCPSSHVTSMLQALEGAAGDFLDKSKGMTSLKPFFSHHLFEALTRHGHIDLLFRRFQSWKSLVELDLRTTPESMPGTRSDSHGWSAHPLFHAIAGIAGIRPCGFGFESVVIRPQPGLLTRIQACVWTPRGKLSVAGTCEDVHWDIQLPDGLSGVFIAGDGTRHEIFGNRQIEWKKCTSPRMVPSSTVRA